MTATREQVLVALRERIVSYATSHLGRDTAEDLAQEALLVLEQKYADVQSADDLLPLCFQILRFKMKDYKRKATRRGEWNSVDVGDLPITDHRPNPAEQAERQELLERLARAVEKLDGRCRELMRLKLLGRSFPEIRASLGAGSINTVYTWDSRCRQSLLAKMGGSWEVPR